MLLGNTESIEDLGINTNVALLETTDAFKQLANGKSWEKLSFQTQQQIRLMGILEQASNKFGTSIQKNTNYQMLQLTANLKDVGLNIGQAFMPIVSVVLPVLNALALALSNATAWLANFMNTLFGTNFTQGAGAVAQVGVSAGGASSGLGEMADSADDASKAVKKAGKAAKGALASFDEINSLSKDAASGGSGGGGTGGGGGATSTPTNTGATPSPINQKMIDAVENFKKALQPTIDALGRLKKALEPFANFAWQGLKDFYELVLKPIGKWVLGEGLPRFIDAISKGLESINWERINESLRELYRALTPFALTIGEGLLTFWEKVLVPLAAWTISEILPRFLTSFATALRIATEVIKGSLEIRDQFFEEFLKPLSEFTAPKILDFLDKFNTKFKELEEQIKNSTALKDLKEILSKVYAVLLPIAKTLIGIGMWFLDFTMSNDFINLKYILKDIEDALGLVAAVLRGDFSDAWDHFKDLIADNKIDKTKEQLDLLKEKFDELADKVRAIGTIWIMETTKMFESWKTKIKEWWDKDVAPWFTTEKWNAILFNIGVSLGLTINKFIQLWNVELPKWWANSVAPWFTIAKWTTLFNSIKTSLITKWTETSTAWSTAISTWWNTKVTPWFTVAKWQGLGVNIKTGLVGGFKGAVNSISGLLNSILSNFESLINKVVTGVNEIIGGYNSVSPGRGIGKLNSVRLGRIPMLARGGIVDRATNMGNYVAGEAGKEMIVPLENTAFVDKLASALGNAVFQAMQFSPTSGSSGSDGGATIVLKMNDVEMARGMLPELFRESKRLGLKWE